MADKLLKGRAPSVPSGVKQSGNTRSFDGPTYPEADGKTSTNPHVKEAKTPTGKK